MPQFCILFYANYAILATQRGCHGTMPPPKYSPGSTSFTYLSFSIRLVFHEDLNSYIAYPGSSPEPSKHTRGQFLLLPSFTLFSDYSDYSLKTRSLERGFSTCITLAPHLVQPHCASITRHGHHKYDKT